MNKILSIDLKVLLLLQSWRNVYFTYFFKVLTYSGTSYAWFTMAFAINFLSYQDIQFIQQQQTFLRGLFSPLLAWLTSTVIKKIVSRARPSPDIEGYRKIISIPDCGSFPSSHTASAFAFFFALCFYQHPWTSVIGVWAVLVSFSRMYLGVHYLSDVVGGFVLGCFSAIVIFQFVG